MNYAASDDEKRSKPFYLDLLKGDRLTQSEIENIIGFKWEDDPERYALDQFKLQEEIDRVLRRSGRDYTICRNKREIVICTDIEAAPVNVERFNRSISKARKAHRKMSAIDVAGYSNGDREKHLKATIAMGQTLRSIPKVQKIRW